MACNGFQLDIFRLQSPRGLGLQACVCIPGSVFNSNVVKDSHVYTSANMCQFVYFLHVS